MAIFAGLALVSVFLLFVAALLSAVLTLVCIFAWNKERQFFGNTITPYEARRFIGFGILGAIVIGLFGEWMYTQGLLLERNREFMPLVGYVVGSIGWGISHAQKQQREEEERAYLQSVLPPIVPRPAAPPAQQTREERAYEFASWDDEEPRA